MTATLAVSVVLLAGTAAEAVTVDGRMDAGEWLGHLATLNDPNEAGTSDNYDISQILVDSNAAGLNVAVEVYGDGPEFAAPGSDQPYLNFYFNVRDTGGGVHRLGVTYNDGYDFPEGQAHLITFGSSWMDLGEVEFAVDEAVEVAVPWSVMPAGLDGPDDVELVELFFLYNVAPGDVNADGRVDLLDLSGVADGFNQTNPGWAGGDLNLDGQTNLLDLGMLSSNWGYEAPAGAPFDIYDDQTVVILGGGPGPGTGGHVPEPLTMTGLAAAVAGLLGYVRRRRLAS
jgi:hypothetical protein